MAHEAAKKIDFRNCLVALKPLPNRRVRRDVGMFQQFCITKSHGVAARLRAPSTFVLSPSMDRGHALQVSKKRVTVMFQLQWHLELLPTNLIIVVPTRDVPQSIEADVGHPCQQRMQRTDFGKRGIVHNAVLLDIYLFSITRDPERVETDQQSGFST